MRQKTSKALYAHWSDLKGNGPIPDRNDLDPAAIGALLQDVFILGQDSQGVWRYRVAGTRLSSLARRELRDEPFAQWWRAADRMDAARMAQGVAEEGAPLVGGIRAVSPAGMQHDFELVLLPLRHGGRTSQRMLGALFPTDLARLSLGFVAEELSLISVRSIDAHPETRIFGVPNPDLLDALERRRSFRVIEGGVA